MVGRPTGDDRNIRVGGDMSCDDNTGGTQPPEASEGSGIAAYGCELDRSW